MTTPERTETGGPTRTPRSEIAAAVPASRKKEPVLLLDLSTSMDWDAAPGRPRMERPDPGAAAASSSKPCTAWSPPWKTRTAKPPRSRPAAATTSAG